MQFIRLGRYIPKLNLNSLKKNANKKILIKIKTINKMSFNSLDLLR